MLLFLHCVTKHPKTSHTYSQACPTELSVCLTTWNCTHLKTLKLGTVRIWKCWQKVCPSCHYIHACIPCLHMVCLYGRATGRDVMCRGAHAQNQACLIPPETVRAIFVAAASHRSLVPLRTLSAKSKNVLSKSRARALVVRVDFSERSTKTSDLDPSAAPLLHLTRTSQPVRCRITMRANMSFIRGSVYLESP